MTLTAPVAVVPPAVRRLPSHVGILVTVGFVVAVALTPREAWPAFCAYAALLLLVAAVAGVRAAEVAPRMLVELPVVVFAAVLPFVAEGSQVVLVGLSLSAEGLWAAWNILAKATLGVAAAVLLALTTPAADLVDGLQRLRVPPVLVQIASFMIRYVDVVATDIGRMRSALLSRGYRPSHLGHAPVVARTAGTVFVRTYERGERVHQAMLSRGFTGTMPTPTEVPASRSELGTAVVLLGIAWLVLILARVVW